MKPQILVLSSTSNYLALNLEKDLKERPFTRLDNLEAYISSDRRTIPFLLILEVANNEDADRAVVAYDWAETIDPRAPARFLILAAKNITFGERTARLRSLETAYVPINSRNLLFKVDLQLKLLEKTVAALPPESTQDPKPRRGFVAEMASLPGRPERVMVLRGATRGEWRRDPVPGAKVRWRWIDEEGFSQKDPSAEPEINVSWAAESSAPPTFESHADGWVLSGHEPDVKAYRNEEEIFSARKLFFGASPEPAAPASAESPAATDGTPPASGEEAQVFSRGAALGGTFHREQAKEASGPPRADELLVRSPGASKNAPTVEEAPAQSSFPSRVAQASAQPRPGPEPSGIPSYATPASFPVTVRQAQDSSHGTTAPVPRPEEHKSYLSTAANPRAPGSISAAASNSQIIDTGKAHLQRSAPAPSSGALNVKEGSGSVPNPAPPSKTRAVSGAEEEAFPSAATPQPFSPEESRSAPPPSATGVSDSASSALRQDGSAEREEKSAVVSAEHVPGEEILRTRGYAQEGEEPAPVVPEGKRTDALPANQLHRGAAEEAPAPQAVTRTKLTPAEEMLAKLAARARDGGADTNFGRTTPDASGSGVRILKDEEAERGDIRVKHKGGSSEEAILSRNAERRADDAQVVANRGPRAAEGEVYERASFIVALAELGDQNSSWQPAGHYRIYLSARHRYYGFRHETELFPLWVYEGELAPEFLEEEKSWRFYDRRPEPYFTRAELPASLSQELFRLLPTAPVAAAVAPTYVANPARPLSSPAGASPEVPTPVRKLGLFSAVLAFVRRLLGN